MSGARLRPSWPLLVGLLGFARALGGGWALLGDPDTYLHIAAGRWMIAHGALPAADPFSHSMPGAPWLVPEWLAELLLAVLYDRAGWGALMVLAAGCFGLTLALITRRLLAAAEPFTALILALASAALLIPHLLVRPHGLALPLMALWSAALFRARDEGRPPPWRYLPVMLLWANLHGGFMAGLALALFLGGEAVALPAAGTTRRAEAVRWGGFVLAAGAASLVTPNGVEGFLEPFRLSRMPVLTASFTEWRSTDFAELQPLELWLLGAILVGLGGGLRLAPARLLLLLGLFHEALGHVRHADLLAVMGPLAISASLGPQIARRIQGERPSRLARRLAALAAPATWPGTALVLGLAALLALPAIIGSRDRPEDAVTPRAALAAARRLGLDGPVLNSEGLGGYLVFSGVRPFIDGRMEMYGDRFLARDLAAEAGHEPALDEILRDYRIAWTLLSPGVGAIAMLDRDPAWQRVYADRYAVIHVRKPAPEGSAPP